MITERMVRMFSAIQGINSRLVFCTPLAWNPSKRRLLPSSPLQTLAYLIYMAYLVCLIVLISFRVYSSQNSAARDIKLTLIDISFIAILLTILVAASIILIDRPGFIKWFNHTLHTDALLQRAFTKYRKGRTLDTSGNLATQVQLTEGLLLLITVGSLAAPFLTTLLFLEGSDPTHRLLQELFGVRIQLSWSHGPFLVVLLSNFWIGVSTADFVLIAGLFHIHSSTFWLHSVTPTVLRSKVPSKDFSVRKNIWGYMNDRYGIRVHRTCEVLSKLSVLDHPIVNVHFASCFLIIVASLFVSLRLGHLIPMPAFLIAPGAAAMASALIFFECLLFTALYDISDGFLSSLSLTYPRKSEPYTTLKGCVPINFGPGKPFFRISKQWNVDFNNSVADQLISLLLSVQI